MSLIELIVVVLILAILASLALPAYSKIKDKAREARAMSEIRQIDKMIYAYSIDRAGAYPDLLTDLGQGEIKDPWGNPYRYLNIIKNGSADSRKDWAMTQINLDYDLYSTGSDSQTSERISEPGGKDDLVRGQNGSYVGLGEKYGEF
jgi:general secretion pathway protein G